MSFTHAQFIAYEVPTGVGLPAGACGVVDLDLVAGVKDDAGFKAAMNSLSDDALARVGRLLAVADLAMKHNAVKKGDKKTLKVFMAPEFYLRPEAVGTASRSYSASDLIGVQAAFRLVFSQKKLSDWLFVLGTIVWNMKGKVVLSKALEDNDDRLTYVEALQNLVKHDVVYNTALVGVGGVGLQIFDKVHYSGADDIQNPFQAKIQKELPDENDKQASEKFEKQKSFFDESVDDSMVVKGGGALRTTLYDYFTKCGAQNMQRCLVRNDNIQCGVEVCLDHDLKVLYNGYQAYKTTWSASNDNAVAQALDLQLLTACGMAVQKSSIILGKNRYVFRVDGSVGQLPESIERFDHSEIQMVVDVDNRGLVKKMLAADTDLKNWKALNKPDAEVVLSDELALNVANAKALMFSGDAEEVDDANPDPYGRVPKDLAGVFAQRLVVYKQLKIV